MLLEVSPEAKVAYVRGCNLFTRRRTNPIEDVAEDMSTSPGNIQLLQFSNAAAPIALVGPADDKISPTQARFDSLESQVKQRDGENSNLMEALQRMEKDRAAQMAGFMEERKIVEKDRAAQMAEFMKERKIAEARFKCLETETKELRLETKALRSETEALRSETEETRVFLAEDFGSLGPRIERDHGRYLAAVLCDKELKARDKADNIVQELQESEQHYKERMRRVSSSEWEILSKTIRIHAPETMSIFQEEGLKFLDTTGSHPSMKEASQNLHGSAYKPKCLRFKQFVLQHSERLLADEPEKLRGLRIVHEAVFGDSQQ